MSPPEPWQRWSPSGPACWVRVAAHASISRPFETCCASTKHLTSPESRLLTLWPHRLKSLRQIVELIDAGEAWSNGAFRRRGRSQKKIAVIGWDDGDELAGAFVRDAIEREVGIGARPPAQVVLRRNLQHAVVTIPRSARPARIAENAAIFDFGLPPDDMRALDALDQSKRPGPDPANFDF